MRILVTGASGLLGSDLCPVLGREHEVTGWARRTQSGKRFPASLESVDVTEERQILSGMARVRPQVVIHAAAISDVDVCEVHPELAMEVNRGAVEKVARACASEGAFLIAISTDYVFDGAGPGPYREEDPAHPTSVYGKSKWEGERAALELAAQGLVVRVSGLFGSGRPNFVSLAIGAFQSGRPVKVVTDQVNSPSYTVDVSRGFERLLSALEAHRFRIPSDPRAPRILHLANAGGASRLEVAQAIARCLGKPESLIERTTWEALERPAKRPPNSRLDCSRFGQATGCFLRPWQEAVEAFIASTALDPRGFS